MGLDVSWMTNNAQKSAYASFLAAQKAYDDFVLKVSNFHNARNADYEGKMKGLSAPMTPQEAEELRTLSNQLIATAQQMKVTLDNAKTEKNLASKKERTPEEEQALKGVRELQYELKRANRTAHRELNYLENADTNNLPSYETLHRQTGEPVIDTGEGALEKVGGFLSDRIPIRYMDENGRLVEGFFTQDFSPEWTVDELYERANAVAPTMKDIFDAIKSEQKLAPLTGWIHLLNSDDKSLYNTQNIANILENIGLPKDLYEGRTFTQEEATALHDLGERFPELAIMKYTHEEAGIEPGSNINQRNTAMSDVAKLLGCENQIAKSEPMTIIVNGQPLHGNFMKKVEGVQTGMADPDHNNLTPITGKTFEPDYKALGESCGNLMILDYICANVDRHKKNLFFDLVPDKEGKKMVMSNVIGIDNDLSFGNKKLKTSESSKNLPALDDIVSIPRKLADTIRTLDKNVLAATLIKNGIAPDQIDACLDRVQKLQAKIQKNKNGFIVDEYTKDSFEKLAKHKPKNTGFVEPDTPFKHGKQVISEVGNFFTKIAIQFRAKVNEIGRKLAKIAFSAPTTLPDDPEYDGWKKEKEEHEKAGEAVPKELQDKIDKRHKERNKLRKENQLQRKNKEEEIKATAAKMSEKEFKNEFNEKMAIKRSVQGVKKLHQKLYMESTGTLKGQAAELKNLTKRLTKLGEGQGQEYEDMMTAAKDLSEVLNDVVKSGKATDIHLNHAAEGFKKLQGAIGKFIPTAEGDNAQKLIAAAECLDNMCDIAKNTRERQVNEINELTFKAVKELADSNKKLQEIKDDPQRGVDSLDYKLAEISLNTKAVLGGSVGNLGPMEDSQININTKAIAKLTVVEHIKSLKEKEPELYQSYADKISADPQYVDKIAGILVNGKTFNTLISTVNVYTAVLSKPEQHIAKELEKNLKLKVFDEIASGERDFNGKLIPKAKPTKEQQKENGLPENQQKKESELTEEQRQEKELQELHQQKVNEVKEADYTLNMQL